MFPCQKFLKWLDTKFAGKLFLYFQGDIRHNNSFLLGKLCESQIARPIMLCRKRLVTKNKTSLLLKIFCTKMKINKIFTNKQIIANDMFFYLNPQNYELSVFIFVKRPLVTDGGAIGLELGP